MSTLEVDEENFFSWAVIIMKPLLMACGFNSANGEYCVHMVQMSLPRAL